MANDVLQALAEATKDGQGFAKYKQSVEAAPFDAPDVQDQAINTGQSLLNAVSTATTTANNLYDNAQYMNAMPEVQKNIQDIKNNFLMHPSLGMTNHYNNLVNSWAQGFTKNLEPKVKDRINGLIAHYQIDGSNQLSNYENHISNNIIQAKHLEYVNARSQDAVKAAYSGALTVNKAGNPVLDSKGKQIPLSQTIANEIDASNQLMLEQGKISPEYAANSKANLQSAITESTWEGKYFKILQAGDSGKAVKFLEKFNKNTNINPELKNRLNIRFRGMLNSSLEMSGVSKSGLVTEGKGLIAQISSGALSPNDQKVVQHTELLRLSGSATLPVFQENVQIASTYAAAAKSWSTLTNKQKQATLDSYNPVAGDTPEQSYIKSRVKTQLIHLQNKFAKQLKDDPFTAVLHSPAMVAAIASSGGAAVDANGRKQQGLNPYPTNATNTSLYLQKINNVPDNQLSVISKPAIQDIVAQTESILAPDGSPDIAKQIQFITQKASMYKDPRQRQIFYQDLYNAKLPRGIMDLAGLNNIPDSSSYLSTIYKGISHPKEVKTLLKAAGTYTFNSAKQSAQSALADTGLFKTIPASAQNGNQLRDEMINNVALAASQYVIDGKGSSMTNACKIMADAIYNNRYSAIIGKIRVPYNVPKDTASNALTTMKRNIKFSKLDVTPLRPGVDEDTTRDAALAGHWENLPSGDGVYWAYPNGVAMTLKGTNKPYAFKWKDLEDPTSDLNKFISKNSSYFSYMKYYV